MRPASEPQMIARPVLLVDPLQPRGQVDGVADDRVLEALSRADVADDDLAAVDADAHAQARQAVFCEIVVQGQQLLLAAQGGAHGQGRLLLGGQRRSPEGHDRRRPRTC